MSMNVKEPLHFLRRSISIRKTWNVAKVSASYGISRLTKRPFVWGVPPVLMIEPTNICNLKCPLCPSGNGTLRRERGFMDFDLYRRIIDDVRGRTHMILLWNQGESFIHPRFLDMIRYASDAGIYTYSSTNGHFLKDPDAVVGSGLDSMIISLDGATPETYREYRVGGKFEKVIEGTKGLVAAKKRLGSKTPIVHIQFILFKHNEHEVGAVRALAEELGVDKMTYKTAQIYEKEDIQVFLPENREFRRYEVEGDSFRLRNGKETVPNMCRKLWLQPVINWDGSVTPCCFDKNGDFTMGMYDGDGRESSFERLWNNDAFNQFRRRVLTDRAAIDMCRNCTEGVKYNREEDIHVI
ncbi:MAG TPA: radical SAM protein [Firmicutes bacterium]|nr:radical SAM protein [Bacillota bacterium]